MKKEHQYIIHATLIKGIGFLLFLGFVTHISAQMIDLYDHPVSQETDGFSESGTETDVELFAFQLQPTPGSQTVTSLTFTLADIAGLTDGDWAQVELIVDDNDDGTINGGEVTAVGGVPTISMAGQTITFSDNITVGTITSYILRADFASLSMGDAVTISLDFTNIVSSASVSGGAASVQHIEINCITWTGASDNSWSNAANWNPNIVPSTADSVVFNSTSNNCYLSTNSTIKAITFTEGYTGTFSLNGFILSIEKDADFSINGSGSIIGGGSNGAFDFVGTNPHTIIPHPSLLLPGIKQNGTGITTVTTNHLLCDSLIILAGTFDMNSYNLSTTNKLKVDNTGTFTGGSGKINIGTSVSINSSSSTLNAPSDSMYVGSHWFDDMGGTFNAANNGLVIFNSTTTSNSIYPGTSNFSHIIFKGSGGEWTLYGNLSADTLTMLNGSVYCGTSYNHTLGYLMSSGNSGSLYFSGCTFSILNDADFSQLSSYSGSNSWIKCQGTGTQNITPKSAYTFSRVVHEGSGTVRILGSQLYVDSLIIKSGVFDLNSNPANISQDLIIDNTGTFTGGSGIVRVYGDVAFLSSSATLNAPTDSLYLSGSFLNNSNGTFNAANGSPVVFNATTTGHSIYPGGANFSHMVMKGNAGEWTLNNNLSADTLTIIEGALYCGNENNHSIGILKSQGNTGTLNFSVCTLTVDYHADFSQLNSFIGSGGWVTFTGAVNQYVTPKSGYTFSRMKQKGTGTVVVQGYPLHVDSLIIESGEVNLNTYNLYVYADLILTGSGKFTGSTGVNRIYGNLDIGSGSAVFNAPSDSLYIGGGFENNSGGTFNQVSGSVLLFNAISGSIGISPGSSNYSHIAFKGSGGEWSFLQALQSDTLSMVDGSLNFGNYTHTLNYLYSSGGSVNFAGCTVNVVNDADFSQFNTVTPGTGYVRFTGTGTQTLTPTISSTLPGILHTGTGTLYLGTNNLTCKSFYQSNGTFNVNFKNITTDTDGDFTIVNGSSSTFQDLSGATLAILGNASFTGQSGNLINMNPGSLWYLQVSGTLTADYANVGYCDASGYALGNASKNCTDAGSNSNWNFQVPPVLSGTGGTLSYTENDAATVLDNTITIVDSDDANLLSALVSISTAYVEAEDTLIFTDQNGISGSYNNSTGVLTLSGTATLVNYEDALHSIAYYNSSDNPDLTNRVVSFQVYDGEDYSNTITRTISITTVNDVPILTGSDTLVTFIENSGAVNLDNTISISDLDHDSCQSATLIISANFFSGEDTLLFTNQNGITGSYDSTSGTLILTGTAAKANYQTALQSITYSNTSDNPSTATRTISYTVYDGISTSNAINASVAVIAINDNPIVNNDSYNTLENSTLTVPVGSGVLVNDFDAEGNSLTATLITDVDSGSLTFNPDGSFTYIPTTDFQGTVTFTYQASDGTGTSSNAIVTIEVNDTTAPQVTSLFPADDAVGIGVNESFMITFNEAVFSDSGNIYLKLYSDLSLVETIDVTSANVTGEGTTIITIDPSTTLSSQTGYFIIIENTCFQDASGNSYPGIGSDTEWNFFSDDIETLAPILNLPYSGGIIDSIFTIDFTLPEDALNGSLQMIIYHIDGTTDTNSPHIITFASDYEMNGTHTTDLVSTNLSDNSNIISVTSEPNDQLVKGATYNIVLQYSDTASHPLSSDTSEYVFHFEILEILGGDYYQEANALKLTFEKPLLASYIDTMNRVGLFINNGSADSTIFPSPWQWQYGQTNDTIYIILDTGQANLVESWNGLTTNLALYLECHTFGDSTRANDLLDYTTGFPVNYVIDSTTPEPVTQLSASAMNCSTMVITWEPSISPDVKGVTICVSPGSMPLIPTVGEYIYEVSSADSLITVTHTPCLGDTLYVSTFVEDYAGNWTDFDTSASTALILTDSIGPLNNIQTTLTNVGDSAVIVSLSLPSLPTRPVSSTPSGIYFAFYFDSLTTDTTNTGTLTLDSSAMIELGYHDTTFTLTNITIPGIWSCAWAPFDSAGNVGQFLYDSIRIYNLPPEIVLIPRDTVLEDSLWSLNGTIYDRNGDSITLTLLNAPENVTLLSPQFLLSWRPLNQHIGTHLITVMATDSRGGSDTASLYLTVFNTNDNPKIITSFIPDTIPEDSAISGLIKVYDPDVGDSLAISITPNIGWLAAGLLQATSDDTLWNFIIQGIPGDRDTGFMQFTILIADRANKADSIRHTLYVVNTNDPPEIEALVFPDTVYEDSVVNGYMAVHDPDLGDTLVAQVSSSTPWLKVLQMPHQLVDTLWHFNLQGIPGNHDTGLIRITLTVIDRQNQATNKSHQLYVINTNDPPETQLSKKEHMYGAAQYLVTGIDDFDSVLTFHADLSAIQNPVSRMKFREKRTGTKGEFNFYPLIDGTYLFTCYTQDQEGLIDASPFYDTLTITGASFHTWSDSGIWNMVSIPAQTYASSSIKTKGRLLHWDESKENNGIYKYYQRTQTITGLSAGNSYWLRLDSGTAKVALSPDDYSQDSLVLPLHNAEFGWNQIASPYPYPVKWNSDLTLWEWDPALRDFIEYEGILYPWQGYWVHTETPDSITFIPKPYMVSRSRSTRSKTCFINKDEWTLGVELTSNVNRDADNLFGVSQYARDGYDQLDRPEPPRLGKEPYLFFSHPEWNRSINKYASDIRNKWDNNMVIFQLGISPSKSNISAICLNITGYNEKDGLYLFVNSPSGVKQYHEGEIITITPQREEQYRTLFVTDKKNFLHNFPYRFALHHPFPNPCRSRSMIKYTLPYRWEKNGWLNNEPYKVKIILYDAKGRTVRELVNRHQRPGHYQILWQGKSNSGRLLATGTYFCHIVAGRYSSVKKIITIR